MNHGKENILGVLVYAFMPLLLIILIIFRRFQLPAYGQEVLQMRASLTIIQIVVGIILVFVGIFASKGEEEIRGGFFKIYMILFGIGICCYSVYDARIWIKDYNATPQTYFFEECKCEKRGRKYYLNCISDGVKYSFNITGIDQHTYEAFDGHVYGVTVTAYPNSNLVVSFEVFQDLKNYAENIPLDTLKHCLTKPIDEEYGVNTLTLLAADKEQDVALYGVQKYDRYGALIRIKDEVFFSSLFWNENNNHFLPEIRYKDIDQDGENELLIQCFFEWVSDTRNVELLIKTGEIYIYDNENGKWSMKSFLSQDCSNALDDRIVLWFSQDGHLTLKLDGQEIDNTDVPADERDDYFYYGNFYMTGAERYDLDNMTLTIKPFHYYKEMIDFVDIEFQMEYKDGEFSVLEGRVLSE